MGRAPEHQRDSYLPDREIYILCWIKKNKDSANNEKDSDHGDNSVQHYLVPVEMAVCGVSGGGELSEQDMRMTKRRGGGSSELPFPESSAIRAIRERREWA